MPEFRGLPEVRREYQWLASCLPFCSSMKHKIKRSASLLLTTLVFSMGVLPILSWVGIAQVQQNQNSQISTMDKQTISAFENRVKNYVKLRNQVKAKLPKLSKSSTPEQLESYRKSFEESLRAARVDAKRGDVFNTEGSDYIRRTLKSEFKGKDRAQLREIVFDAQTQAVKLRVNYPYPEPTELVEMPATVLLNLPQLPKEIKYRFVGHHLLLVDRDNNLIIDYMLDALP